MVWAKRSLDPGVPIHYQEFVDSKKIVRIYLDELDEMGTGSIQLDIVKLVVESEAKARKQAKPLMERAISEVEDESLKRDVIELIEKVLVYKFTSKSREELRKMIYTEAEWKQSKLYQSLREEVKEDVEREVEERVEQKVKEEVKLESVLSLLNLGLTVEQIAKALDLSIAKVQQISDERSSH